MSYVTGQPIPGDINVGVDSPEVIYPKDGFVVNVNVGSGQMRGPDGTGYIPWKKDGWIPVDKEVCIPEGLKIDVLNGGLVRHFGEDSVDAIYTSATLEHFVVEETQEVMAQFHTILRPGGALRISVPDIDVICRQFLDGDREWWCNNDLSGRAPGTELEDWEIVHCFLAGIGVNRASRTVRVGHVARGHHYSAYNQVVLRRMLTMAGFADGALQFCAFGKTKFEIFADMDRRGACSIHVEAQK